jgi:hypothetical protein
MNQTQVPTALLSIVKRDLSPIRPLASPSRRALALLPLGLMLIAGMPAFWHWQAHVKLAPWSSWSVSALEIGLSLIVLAAAFREAVPGRELSGRKLSALIVIACAGFMLFNSGTQTPAPPAAHIWMHWLWECLYMTISFSIPALVAPAWLVARALPNRPALTGALCGLGVGIMADAGLRLFCWDAGFAHLIVAHGGAIALLVMLGALCATLVERIKRSGGRHSSAQRT